MNLSEVVSECYTVENSRNWWVDTMISSIFEVMFSNFKELNGELLFMGNSKSSKVEGQGKVTLKMIFGKEIILNNAYKF